MPRTVQEDQPPLHAVQTAFDAVEAFVDAPKLVRNGIAKVDHRGQDVGRLGLLVLALRLALERCQHHLAVLADLLVQRRPDEFG